MLASIGCSEGTEVVEKHRDYWASLFISELLTRLGGTLTLETTAANTSSLVLKMSYGVPLISRVDPKP